MPPDSNKNNALLLGCIADDLTGATDLALMLTYGGLPTTVILGQPSPDLDVQTQAVVIALKIRTTPAAAAVAASEAALDWLIARHTRQVLYKYCSTFDSTADGNIGPVCDALLARLRSDFTVLLPALPVNGRTVVNGDLLVDGVPLARSSMRDHPLTPMTESSIAALMDAQTATGRTGVIETRIVAAGSQAIAQAITSEQAAGRRYASIDTRNQSDLLAIAEAVHDMRLVTGSSGIGATLAQVLKARGLVKDTPHLTPVPRSRRHAAVLAGSCSQITRQQVDAFKPYSESIVIDPLALADGTTTEENIADQALAAIDGQDLLIYSSAAPDSLRAIQQRLGVDQSARLVENTLAFVAEQLAAAGVNKFIVAGGETSGAVAKALGIESMQVGVAIDPGVPWMVASAPRALCLAFKSGNFGRREFFRHALQLLP